MRAIIDENGRARIVIDDPEEMPPFRSDPLNNSELLLWNIASRQEAVINQIGRAADALVSLAEAVEQMAVNIEWIRTRAAQQMDADNG